MNKTLLFASVLAAFVTGVHVVAGGKDVASPLLASGLADEPRLTLYAAWHMVSALLGISALVLVRASLPPHQAGMVSAVRLVALLWLASGFVFLVVAARTRGPLRAPAQSRVRSACPGCGHRTRPGRSRALRA